VKLSDLEACFADGATINDTALVFAGLLRNLNKPVKILGNGELTKKLNVTVQAFTKSAKEAIEKVGGTTATESIKEARVTLYKSLASLGEEIEGK
jgi:large subunit ribosomal protein L15